MHSDWFSLGRDFAVRTISMETVISSVFFVSESQQIYSNFATKTTKRKRLNALIFAKLPKRLFFTELTIRTRKTNIHEANFIILKIWKRLM